MRGHRKERSKAEEVAPNGCGRDAGERDRNEAARLPFEEQQLDAQQDRGDRRRKRRGHAGRGARDEQRLALGAREMKELRDERAERAAGHDDRPLGAERASRADRDRRGERLQHGQLRFHSAAVDQDRFDRLGNAVAADALGAVTRHHPDD